MAHGRIGHALEELGGTTDSTPEEAVHEARKDVKKLRALLRLVRSSTSATGAHRARTRRCATSGARSPECATRT